VNTSDNVGLYSASIAAPYLGLINILFTDGAIIIQSAGFAHIGVDESDILTQGPMSLLATSPPH